MAEPQAAPASFSPPARGAASGAASGEMDVDADMYIESAASASSSANPDGVAEKDPLKAIPKTPIVVLMIGMAGSGKSTWMHRMVIRLQSEGKRVYTVNLDPAVRSVAYPVNIDIRDTVNYKEVMKHFGLGPNGGIMTSLNLFATKFDQVLELLDKRVADLDYVLIDTPGQIEVFNWSASGQIICDALAVSYTTVVCYVVDTARCAKPVTFMSNMLYACSILYKTKLPFIVAFNKIDVMPHTFLVEWMEDFEKVNEALSRETSYVASLARSMSLAMEEFYKNLRSVGVSAVTGQGCADFMLALNEARDEFHDVYVPFLLEQRRDMEEKRQLKIQEQLRDFERDLEKSKAKKKRSHPTDEAEDDDDPLSSLTSDVRDFNIQER